MDSLVGSSLTSDAISISEEMVRQLENHMANQNTDKQNPGGVPGSRDPQHEGRADQNRIQQNPGKLDQNKGQGQMNRGGEQNRSNPQGQGQGQGDRR
jgi:hypothetical protein